MFYYFTRIFSERNGSFRVLFYWVFYKNLCFKDKFQISDYFVNRIILQKLAAFSFQQHQTCALINHVSMAHVSISWQKDRLVMYASVMTDIQESYVKRVRKIILFLGGKTLLSQQETCKSISSYNNRSI